MEEQLMRSYGSVLLPFVLMVCWSARAEEKNQQVGFLTNRPLISSEPIGWSIGQVPESHDWAEPVLGAQDGFYTLPYAEGMSSA